jgi:hypothetical protein
LNGGGVGGIGVAEADQEEQLVPEDATWRTHRRVTERNS